AIAMGELNVASGWGSLAMGFQTNAVGNFSGVIGNADTANGTGSMAFGQNLTATGSNSIVMGNSATANNSGSFVFSDGSARAFDNGANQFVALASGGVTFYTNNTKTFYMKMDNSGVLQNTSGNTIFPGGSQGVGGQAINWSIPNPGYALSVTNTSGASTGGDGVGIFVADNTSSSYALNVGSNLLGQLFSVRGDGLVSVSNNLNVNGQFQMNNTTVMHQFGTQNIFVGASSGNQTMTGAQNAGFGVATLPNNTTGGANTAIGYTALQLNTTGGSNTAVGGSAMFENLSGVQNTAMGLNALFNNTSGGDNTAIGAGAMITNTTGNNNTALGQGADVQGNVSNAMALGSGATVSANNTIQLGNSSITDVSTSGTLHVPQIDNNGSGVTVNDNVTLAKATSVATTSDGSGNYNVGASDFMITETAAGTVNLPAANAKAGRVLVIYDASGAVVTVTPGAGDTIAGAANVVLNTTGNSVTLISDGGTNWVAAGGW
ncbi:MAG TPA: hypothetical protein VFJ29_04255, partial [Candidatus Kapabacteria bacterium]|nr:hypothetical protein [Candidatus Kapabacteria bacterium]